MCLKTTTGGYRGQTRAGGRAHLETGLEGDEQVVERDPWIGLGRDLNTVLVFVLVKHFRDVVVLVGFPNTDLVPFDCRRGQRLGAGQCHSVVGGLVCLEPDFVVLAARDDTGDVLGAEHAR